MVSTVLRAFGELGKLGVLMAPLGAGGRDQGGQDDGSCAHRGLLHLQGEGESEVSPSPPEMLSFMQIP